MTVKAALHVRLLIAAEREPDDVDVIPLEPPDDGGAPPAPDVEQCHARLQSELAQREVDLGDLRLFQGHVIALEVRAAIGPRRIQEEREELVGQVVVRLYVLEMRFQADGIAGIYGQGTTSDLF